MTCGSPNKLPGTITKEGVAPRAAGPALLCLQVPRPPQLFLQATTHPAVFSRRKNRVGNCSDAVILFPQTAPSSLFPLAWLQKSCPLIDTEVDGDRRGKGSDPGHRPMRVGSQEGPGFAAVQAHGCDGELQETCPGWRGWGLTLRPSAPTQGRWEVAPPHSQRARAHTPSMPTSTTAHGIIIPVWSLPPISLYPFASQRDIGPTTTFQLL